MPVRSEEPEEDGKGATWALGVGISALSFPAYVGSDERTEWVLPFPYVRYDSKHLKIDRTALSGLLPLTEDVRLELSLGGSVPVDSDDSQAREDMRDLDWVGEIGPALKYAFYRSGGDAHRLSAELPARSAFAVEPDEVRQIGWISTPLIEYRRRLTVDEDPLTLSASMGPVFGDGRYHNYYYRVRAKEARRNRPAYDADGGYGGWRTTFGLSYRWYDVWFGAFVRYINLEGAVFEDSPLVRTQHYLMGGIATAWVFASSDGED